VGWKPLLAIAKFLDDNLHKEIIKKAEEQSQIKAYSDISEGSIDYEILKVISLFLAQGKNRILIKEIQAELPFEKKPASKTIGKYMDNFGFRDYSRHFREGNGYELSLQIFKDLISQRCPSLFSSFSSQSSQEDNSIDVKVKEEVIEDVKNNEECELINLKCHICGESPCISFDNSSQGKPIF